MRSQIESTSKRVQRNVKDPSKRSSLHQRLTKLRRDILPDSAINFFDTTPKKILLGLFVGSTFLLAGISYSLWKRKKAQEAMQKQAEAKRNKRDAELKSLELPNIEIPPEKRKLILESDVTKLHMLLDEHIITSEMILIVYFEVASSLGLKNGYITEINFEEALQAARECDRLRKEDPDCEKGPLFGIPVAIKDSFILKNLGTTVGMAARANAIAQEDGLVVKVLKSQGAIPFVKTNTGQTLETYHCSNFIWGEAVHPDDPKRIIGGGEAGLVATRGSVMGLGSDIKGCLRLSALNSGLYSFKPTGKRLIMSGHFGGLQYFTGHRSFNEMASIGPIAKSINDLELMMRCFTDAQQELLIQEPLYMRKTWEEDETKITKKLKIGYIKQIGEIPVSPANGRAVQEIVNLLQQNGHQVVEFDVNGLLKEILRLADQTLFGIPAREFIAPLQGERPVPENIERDRIAYTSELWIRIKALTFYVMGRKDRAKKLLTSLGVKPHELFQRVLEIDELRLKFIEQWMEQGLDALVSPGLATPALPIKDIEKTASSLFAYAGIFNVLNLPTGALPVTRVNENEQYFTQDSAPQWRVFQEAMLGTQGLPVGVQISTLPFEEEKCIGVMRIADNYVKNKPQ